MSRAPAMLPRSRPLLSALDGGRSVRFWQRSLARSTRGLRDFPRRAGWLRGLVRPAPAICTGPLFGATLAELTRLTPEPEGALAVPRPRRPATSSGSRSGSASPSRRRFRWAESASEVTAGNGAAPASAVSAAASSSAASSSVARGARRAASRKAKPPRRVARRADRDALLRWASAQVPQVDALPTSGTAGRRLPAATTPRVALPSATAGDCRRWRRRLGRRVERSFARPTSHHGQPRPSPPFAEATAQEDPPSQSASPWSTGLGGATAPLSKLERWAGDDPIAGESCSRDDSLGGEHRRNATGPESPHASKWRANRQCGDHGKVGPAQSGPAEYGAAALGSATQERPLSEPARTAGGEVAGVAHSRHATERGRSVPHVARRSLPDGGGEPALTGPVALPPLCVEVAGAALQAGDRSTVGAPTGVPLWPDDAAQLEWLEHNLRRILNDEARRHGIDV